MLITVNEGTDSYDIIAQELKKNTRGFIMKTILLIIAMYEFLNIIDDNSTKLKRFISLIIGIALIVIILN